MRNDCRQRRKKGTDRQPMFIYNGPKIMIERENRIGPIEYSVKVHQGQILGKALNEKRWKSFKVLIRKMIN